MKNLDDLYQELVIKNKVMKSSFLKSTSSFLIALGGLFHPLLFLMYFPTMGFLIQCIYNGKQFSVLVDILFNSNIKLYEEYIFLNSNYEYLLSEINQNVFQKMNLTEPMEIFAVSYYMICNGFLSINHEFYKEENIDYCKFTLGTSIVSGSGICRNLGPFLNDLLKECNYESYNVDMVLQDQHLYRLSNDYYSSYKKEEDKYSKESKKLLLINLLQKLFVNPFNHAATLLANNDESYIMDLMHNTFYCIHGKHVYPYYSTDEVKTNLAYDLYDKTIKIPPISSERLDKEKLVHLYLNARMKCDDSSYIFQRFYFEHRELYEEIVAKRNEFVEKQLKIKSLVIK